MEKRGVIKGYTVLIDPAAVGKELMVFCQVSLKTHNTELLEVFESHVKELSEVTSVYHVAGNYDYLVQVQVAGMSEYQMFLKEKLASIPNIANVQSTFVLSSLKKS
jgi:DNA-binding Lrp family transcriptional regulator